MKSRKWQFHDYTVVYNKGDELGDESFNACWNHVYEYIEVNKAFLKQPKWVQNAILCHELGHAQLHTIFNWHNDEKNLNQEIEADWYGYQFPEGKRIVEVLQMTLPLCITKAAKKDIRRRITALKQRMKDDKRRTRTNR